jgi:hypothetical protein
MVNLKNKEIKRDRNPMPARATRRSGCNAAELFADFGHDHAQFGHRGAVHHRAVWHGIHPLRHGDVEQRLAGLSGPDPLPVEHAAGRGAFRRARHVVGGGAEPAGCEPPQMPVAMGDRAVALRQGLAHVQRVLAFRLADAVGLHDFGWGAAAVFDDAPGMGVAGPVGERVEGGGGAGEVGGLFGGGAGGEGGAQAEYRKPGG